MGADTACAHVLKMDSIFARTKLAQKLTASLELTWLYRVIAERLPCDCYFKKNGNEQRARVV